MKKVLKRLKKLFQSREIEVGLPKKLTQIIDDYELPAILTTYDAVNPLVLHGNKKHCKLTGYQNKEIIGKSPKTFQGKLTADGVKRDIRESLSKSSFWHGDVINYKKDGTSQKINLIIFGICFDGNKYYVALKKVH